MSVTIMQICDAIATTLGAAPSIVRIQSYDELTEAVQSGDMPALQVYWESNDCSFGSGTDRHTFQGGRRIKEYLIHADILAKQRSHIGEDNAMASTVYSEIETIMEQQNIKPYFGLGEIQAFRWRADRVQIVYADTPIMGVRFAIAIYVY